MLVALTEGERLLGLATLNGCLRILWFIHSHSKNPFRFNRVDFFLLCLLISDHFVLNLISLTHVLTCSYPLVFHLSVFLLYFARHGLTNGFKSFDIFVYTSSILCCDSCIHKWTFILFFYILVPPLFNESVVLLMYSGLFLLSYLIMPSHISEEPFTEKKCFGRVKNIIRRGTILNNWSDVKNFWH